MLKRLKAGSIHLLIGALVIALTIGFSLLLWYPGEYYQATGVKNIFILIALVDVTIGPLITIIVYNPAKKNLKTDLAIVVALQALALLYGVNTVFAGRPAYLVYNVDIFTLVSAADIPEKELKKSGIRMLPITGPEIVGAKLPLDNTERSRILMSALDGEGDLPQMPKYFVKYDNVASLAAVKALTSAQILSRVPTEKIPEITSRINLMIAREHLLLSEVGFVPVRGKQRDMTMLIRKKDGGIIGLIPILPWGE